MSGHLSTFAADAARVVMFPSLMAFAASSDLLTMTISNRISFILVGGFFALALPTGMAGGEILDHVGAMGIALAVTLAFFVLGWVGGGDAKLAATTALWLGSAHLFDYLVYASLLGGLLTLVVIQFRKLAMPARLIGRLWAERLHQTGGGVPYGVALAAAALLIYPSTTWMQPFGA